MNIERHFTGKNIALVAVFAALIAGSSIVPQFFLASGVPITLQTFAIVLAALVLGPWRGSAATALYLAAGTLGAPIFSGGKSGLAPWSGVTAGYLASFTLAAFIVGYLTVWLKRKNGTLELPSLIGAGLASMPVIYFFGVAWLAYKIQVPVFNAAEGATTGLSAGLIPYVVGDVLKIALAAVVAVSIHRAFPQLLASTPTAAAEAPVVAKPAKQAAKQVASTK